MPPHESATKPNNGQPQATPLTAHAGQPAPPQKPGPAPAGDGVLRQIPLDEIDEHPRETRKYSDPERDEELKASLREHGLQNAIIVYPDPETKRYRRVAGGRRCRAAKALGWKTILARILPEVPDEAETSLLIWIDNDQRQNLSDIERGIASLDVMTRNGWTASALAQKLGKPITAITRPLNLVKKLPEDVRALVGPQLPPSVAQLLTSLPDDDSKRRFAALYTSGQITTGQALAAAIKAAKNGHTTSPTSGFSCEEGGVKIAITWTGNADAQGLSNVENTLRTLLKDLASQKHRGLTHWKNFLDKKAKAARKAADLAEAQKALAHVSNPPPERSTTNG
jgi:ParB/RepB/Spo0J family partition protein